MLKSVTCASRLQPYQNLIFQLANCSVQIPNHGISKRNLFLLSHNCLYNYNARQFVDKTSKIEKQEKFIQFWEEYRLRFMHQKRCVDKLIELLEFPRDEAKKLVREETQLYVNDIDITEKKINLLTESGVSSEVIRNNTRILHFALPRLKLYIGEMKRWSVERCDFHEFLAVLNETPPEFFNISKRFMQDKHEFPYGNRIVYLAKSLNCPISELLPRVLKNKNLMRRHFKCIDENLKLYTEYGVKIEDLASDLNALCRSPLTVRRNLLYLKEMGMHSMKPWMVRVDLAAAKKSLETFQARKEVLSDKSHIEFLAAHFEVDEEEMMEMKEDLQRKYPFLFHIKPLLFVKKLKFLVGTGYISKELLEYPHIFNWKISTINERIQCLQQLGVQKPCLKLLCKRSSDFQQNVNHLLARQGMKPCESN